MTNEEFQQQIEQMLAVQHSLQESDLGRVKPFEPVGQQFEQASERMKRTDQQLAQHLTQPTQLMATQDQRFALVSEVLGIRNGQIRELYGRVDTLENS